jgi:hypothetical protein
MRQEVAMTMRSVGQGFIPRALIEGLIQRAYLPADYWR